MRSLVGLRCGLAARTALTRWQQAVAMERFTRGMAIQLQAAARQEEAELREQRCTPVTHPNPDPDPDPDPDPGPNPEM